MGTGWIRIAVDFTRLPPALPWNAIDRMVAHYTAAKNVPDGDPGEDLTQFRDYLRAIERDYLANRVSEPGYTRVTDGKHFPGYHTGYNFGIDWMGGVWEIRGFDYISAATNNHNGHTIAVLFLVDSADAANANMWASARAIGREAAKRTPLTINPQYIDHGTLTIVSGTGTPTACAGAGIRAQCSQPIGNIWSDSQLPDPPPTPAPTPDPTPLPPPVIHPTTGAKMLYCYLDSNGTIWVGNGVHRRALASMGVFSNYVLLSVTGGGPKLVTANGKEVRQAQDVAQVGGDTIEALGVPI